MLIDVKNLCIDDECIKTEQELHTEVKIKEEVLEEISIENPQIADKLFSCEICDKTFTMETYLRDHKKIHEMPNSVFCNIYNKKISKLCNLRQHKLHMVKKTLACSICDKTFTQQSSLMRHKRNQHSSEQSILPGVLSDVQENSFKSEHVKTYSGLFFSCDICEKMFESELNFVTHKRYHTEQYFSCNVCEIAFTHLSEHTILKIEDKPFYIQVEKQFHIEPILIKQEVNDNVFKTKLERKSDLTFESEDKILLTNTKKITEENIVDKCKRMHAEKNFPCDVCGKTFNHRGNLKVHKQVHTGDKPYLCDDCGMKFSLPGHLVRHKLIHTGKKSYLCDVCDKAFTRADYLNRHKLIHTGEKSFSCYICEKTFNQQRYLDRHKLIHSANQSYSIYKNEGCVDDSGSVTKMCIIDLNVEKRHVKIKDLRIFKCDICERVFKKHHNLIQHKNSHKDEKPYTCALCHKTYKTRKSLKQHKHLHTDRKRYSCDICDKTYTAQGTLTQHKRTHTGEKPFKCHICDKQFTTKSPLPEHLRTHTGEKPYACEKCGKCFSHSSTLLKHQQVHSEQKAYKCSYCFKGFTQQGNLMQHERIHNELMLFKEVRAPGGVGIGIDSSAVRGTQ